MGLGRGFANLNADERKAMLDSRLFEDAILNNKDMIVNKSHGILLRDFYHMQMETQRRMVKGKMYDEKQIMHNDELPGDYPEVAAYHTLHLLSELGEVLEADKRWKSHRKDKFNLDEKHDEIMDLIVISLNLAIYSGMSADDVETKLKNKMIENKNRLENLK